MALCDDTKVAGTTWKMLKAEAMEPDFFTQPWFVGSLCCLINLLLQNALEEEEMELVNKLLAEQAKVGKNQALVQPVAKSEAGKSKVMAHNIQEESKDAKSQSLKVRRGKFERNKTLAVVDKSWDATIDQMWRGVPGHNILSPHHLTMVLWWQILTKELEAARLSGWVPKYLRAIYNYRFPPTLDEVQRRCPICWEVCSKLANT